MTIVIYFNVLFIATNTVLVCVYMIEFFTFSFEVKQHC